MEDLLKMPLASCPCDWLLLVLAMRTRGGAPLTKTDGKVDE